MKKGSKIIIVLIFIILLVIITGGGYYFFNEKNNTDKEIQNLNSQIEELRKNIGVKESKDVTQISKKVDESKPWVYDAEYLKKYTEKEFSTLDNYKTSECLKIPYINIDSEDAEKANKEIKEISDKLYEKFGEKYGDDIYYITSMKYKYSDNENGISLLILYDTGITNSGDIIGTIKTYNFNEKGELVNNYSDIKEYNKNDLVAKIEDFSKIKDRKDEDKIKLIDGEYFVSKGNVYVVCSGGYTSGGERNSRQCTMFNVTENKEVSYGEMLNEVFKDDIKSVK